ncbi:hypothetical protein ScPMuIL_017228 [Solemya velum]
MTWLAPMSVSLVRGLAQASRSVVTDQGKSNLRQILTSFMITQNCNSRVLSLGIRFCSTWNTRALRSGGSNGEFTTDLKRFLIEVGTDPREARYWLKQFKADDPNRFFALIHVEADVFSDIKQLENFASYVSFLQRNGMLPVAVCGNSMEDNMYMTLECLKERRSDLLRNLFELSILLESHGVRARPLFSGSGVVQAVQQRPDSFGGTVSGVNCHPIQWCLHTKHVPVIPAVGETSCGQIVAVDAWKLTDQLARALQPLKVMQINTYGGFVDEDKHVVANVNLPTDLQNCSDKTWYTANIKEKVTQIQNLLKQLPSQSSVVITSVDKMVQELFTHRGSGTFFKITEPILTLHSLEGINVPKLRNLLVKSFGKELASDYFDEIRTSLHTLYLSEDYSAAAVVLKVGDLDIAYLDKFAVSLKAQGEGTGEMLWERLRADLKQLFWRSRGSNPVNSWYFKKSEGSWSNGKWTVFWYGVCQPSLSLTLIDCALSKESTFIEPANKSKAPQTAGSSQS